MATASLPDDGIPVLTDVVDPGSSGPAVPQRPLAPPPRPATIQRPAPAPAVQSDPLFKTMPLAILQATAAEGPNSIGRPAVEAAPAAGIRGPAAPPISGPPSLSEFPTVPGTISEKSLEDMASRVHAAVLQGLLNRVEPLLEARLRESIADLLEQVLAEMTAELKVTARNVVRDAVARGIVDEIDALQARLHARR